MNALRLQKYSFDAIYFVASTLIFVAAWVFLHGNGKKGFDTFPLPWFFMAVFAPLISTYCRPLVPEYHDPYFE